MGMSGFSLWLLDKGTLLNPVSSSVLYCYYSNVDITTLTERNMRADFTLSISVFLTDDEDDAELVEKDIDSAKALAEYRLAELIEGTNLTASIVKGGAEDGYLWATVRGQFSDDGWDSGERHNCTDVAIEVASTENIRQLFNPNGCAWFEWGDDSAIVRGLTFTN